MRRARRWAASARNNSYAGGTAINGGTLQISSDANLGDGAGDIRFSGGMLCTTADLTSGRDMAFVGAGIISTRTFDVTLQDISQGSARIRTEPRPVDWEGVVLSLPNLAPLAGVARWVGGTVVGISFNERLSFEMLARWIQEQHALGKSSAASSAGREIDAFAKATADPKS